MEESLITDLLPSGLKNYMKTIRWVGTCAGIGVVCLLLLMMVLGFIDDLTTGIVFASMVFLLSAVCMVPGIIYDKISQSSVCLNDKQIYVLDKRGACWRSINYDEITGIQVKDISGFFYGHSRGQFQFKYICVFLNGSSSLPNVSYSKLFTHKDFILIGFQPEVLVCLHQKVICPKMGDSSLS